VVEQERNVHYRKLRTLVFRPTHDLGEIALEHARGLRPEGIGPRLLQRLANQRATWQSDLVSFLCFDGPYAGRLIDLGRRDARARAEEIVAFFKN
jgi:NTE family protein